MEIIIKNTVKSRVLHNVTENLSHSKKELHTEIILKKAKKPSIKNQ
jgi:hypothetical protein